MGSSKRGMRRKKSQHAFVLRCFSKSMKRKLTPGGTVAVWSVGIALAAIAIWIIGPRLRHSTPLEPPASNQVSLVSEGAASKPGRVVGVFAASIEELRARNHVTLIPVSKPEKTLAEIPAGSYAFVFTPYLAHSSSDALQMYAHNDPAYFEVHKLIGSQTQFVGYVASETQERLREGLGKGEKLTLYSSPWPKAPNLAAIPLRSVKCARSRDISVRRKGSTTILFALDCRAL
jgi:hypothetical protein